MPSEKKAVEIANLKELVSGASAFYFLDFTGVRVNDFNATRRKLGEVGSRVRVVKNRLALRAMAESGVSEDVAQFLTGPTVMVLAGEDPVLPARLIREIARKLEALKFKGAYVDGTFYAADSFTFLATLPTKPELRGQLVGVLAAPVADFVHSLEGLMSEFAYVLEQLQDRKEPSAAA